MTDDLERIVFEMSNGGFRCHDGEGNAAAIRPLLGAFAAMITLHALVLASEGCQCENCAAMAKVAAYLRRCTVGGQALDVEVAPARSRLC